jgi:hypothetical protein
MWMNEHDIDEALHRFSDHPLLGPAMQTLDNLRRAVNRNSDGWAYWPKPARAADKLMELITRDGTARWRFDDERADVTENALKAAYRPIKAFRTRHGIDFEIVEPWVKKPVPSQPVFPEAEAIAVLAASNCGSPVGYRVIREANAPRCYQDCLAPGSSPHAHPKVIGYLLVGTTGTVETNADLMPHRSSTLHPFGTAA